MVVEFDAERPLTQREIDSLEATVYTQVAEPQVLADPDADWVDAEYWTANQDVRTEAVPTA
jgi:hypothetical protein